MPPKGHLVHGSEQEIAEHVIEDIADALGAVVSAGGEVYTWNSKQWAGLSRTNLFRFIKEYDGFPYGESSHRRPIKLSNQKIEAVEKLVVRNSEQPGFFDRPAAGIPCENGFITIENDQAVLVPHHPDHRNRHVVPVAWDGAIVAERPERTLLKRLLDGVVQGDPDAEAKRAVLAEVAGVALSGCSTGLKAPKAVILYGPGAENGKSQFQRVLQGLVPADAQVTLSPSMLGNTRSIAALDGAVLVSASEIGGKAIASEELKAAVTGDPMPGCPLYRSSYTVVPKALHVYSTNTLPGFSAGMDAGVRRRLLIIMFNRTIPPEDRIPEIGVHIVEHELALAFAWAIGGWLRVVRQGGFSPLPSSEAALKDWVLISDPVECWLDDPTAVRITGIETDRMTTREAFAAFKRWGEIEGLRDTELGHQARFTQRLREFSARGILIRKSNRGNVVHGLRRAGPDGGSSS